MKSQILESLIQKHTESGGHCGLYFTDFKGKLNQVREELNKLYKENKITIHDGIHGKLIKYNPL